MAGKPKSSLFPTSIEEVELKGEGGLRRAFLFRTVISIVLMGIVFLIASLAIFSRVLEKELSGELSDIGLMIIDYYDQGYPGDYNLVVDEEGQPAFLKKGDAVISDDMDYLNMVSEQTASEITFFFYNTRMMSTISDTKGKPINHTIANDNITTEVLIGGQKAFFNNVEINKIRYCASYVPIFVSEGTCVGMVGVGRPYDEAFVYVRRMAIVYAVIVLVVGALAALWISMYTNKLVIHLDKLKDFLGQIASGYLDDDLDQTVLNREDEVGDMGRCALYVRGALKKLVERDPLTNLNNRRSGQMKMDQIRRNASKYGTKYAVGIGDIDFFKKVNDTYGHDAGDAVLKEVARILTDKMAGKGTVIRWGGEEFLFVFEDCNMETARDYLWDILQTIRDTYVDYDGQIIRFTMSYGVVGGNPARRSEEEVNAADELLYYAKEHGRNRVVSSKNEDDVEPAPKPDPIDTILELNAQEEEDPSELWDIYDRNKELTGRTMKRNDFTMKDGDYHLTVLGAVVNRQGEFLVTRRVMSKSYAPGWWEISGGAAMAGETSYKAIVREIKEETALDVTGADGGYMFTYRRDNPDEGDNYFVDVYKFEMDFTDEDIRIQREEADGYMLARPEDIAELGEDGVFLHYQSIKELFKV